MKITKSKLKQIIKEELRAVVESSMFGPTSLPKDRDDEEYLINPNINFDPEKDILKKASAAYDSSLNTVASQASEKAAQSAEGSYGMTAKKAHRRQMGRLKSFEKPNFLTDEEARVHQYVINKFNQKNKEGIQDGWRSRLKAHRNKRINLANQPEWLIQGEIMDLFGEAEDALGVSWKTIDSVLQKLDAEERLHGRSIYS